MKLSLLLVISAPMLSHSISGPKMCLIKLLFYEVSLKPLYSLWLCCDNEFLDLKTFSQVLQGIDTPSK